MFFWNAYLVAIFQENITNIKPRISINMYAIIYFTIMVSFQNKSYINAELTYSEKAKHLNVLEIILNDI